MKKLYERILEHDVISFDIFDTLLLRPFVSPTDVFEYIERVYNAHGFLSARQNAEHIFYKANPSVTDANLDDIYSVIPDSANQKQHELDLEFAGLGANPEILAAYNFAKMHGKKIIIASDMYLPYDFIIGVLKKNGIDGFDKLYLSNDVKKRKDRGDMYDFITSDLNVSPKSILHIGDNKHSDFNVAKKHGLDAFLYYGGAARFLGCDTRFKQLAALGTPDASIISALAAQYCPCDNYWINFGYRFAGPLAYSYAKYIFDGACTENLNAVLFVARDGWLIQQVFDIIANNKIRSEYVYAPRILNYTVNLDYDENLPEQARIICEHFNLDTNGITPNQYLKQNITSVKKLANTEKKRTGYDRYITNKVGTEKIVGVVDTISGQLSGQKLIQKSSRIKTVGFYVATIPGRKILSEMAHHDYLDGEMRDVFFNSGLQDLIELVFSAPENPIKTMLNGEPVYQNIAHPAEATRHQICQCIARGALQFANDFIVRTNNSGITISAHTIHKLLFLYLNNPEKEDVSAMYDVMRSPFADNSVYLPLFSSPTLLNISQMQKLIWKTPLQRMILVLAQPIKIRIRGLKKIHIILFPNIRTIFNLSVLDRYGVYIGNKNT